MKRKVLSMVTALTIVISLFSGITVSAAFDGGSGTESDPYLIGTEVALKSLANSVNLKNTYTTYSGKYFKLTNDIALSEGWISIGKNAEYDAKGQLKGAFAGTFDGDGHKITGLLQQGSRDNNLGLFAYNYGTIKNLTVNVSINVQSNISGADGCIGGIATRNYGVIENCACEGEIEFKGYPNNQWDYVGGIAGYNSGTISNCYNSANIKTDKSDSVYHVGGITGVNERGTIKNCYNTGTLNLDDIEHFSYCYRVAVGGIVGADYDDEYFMEEDCCRIENCYNTGTITVQDEDIVRHAIGNIYIQSDCPSYVKDSYYLNTCGGGDERATALTSAEFANESSFANWDFKNVWIMSESLGRPVLRTNMEGRSEEPDRSGCVGSYYSYSAAGTADAGSTFKLARGIIPSGLTLDPSTGVISGTPKSYGLYPNIWIQTTDANGKVTEACHSILIKPREITVQITDCDYTYTKGQTYRPTVTCVTDSSIPLTVICGTYRVKSVSAPGMYKISISANGYKVAKIIDADGNALDSNNLWLIVRR